LSRFCGSQRSFTFHFKSEHMSNVPSKALDLACRVLAREAGLESTIEGKEGSAQAAIRAFDKLRAHMCQFVGVDGYQSLLARARIMSKDDAAWLDSVRVLGDARLEGFLEAALDLDGPEIARGSAVLMGNLMSLLIKFIGAGLTVGLISEVWPGFAVSSTVADTEEQNV
jgi:hypothetical protein